MSSRRRTFVCSRRTCACASSRARSASLDLTAARPTCWRHVATSCGMRAQLPEGPISSFSCTDWPSRMAYEPQIVHASDAEHCPTSGGAVPMEQISPRDGRFVRSDARCYDVRGSRGWTRQRAGRNRTGQILAQNGLGAGWPIGRIARVGALIDWIRFWLLGDIENGNRVRCTRQRR